MERVVEGATVTCAYEVFGCNAEMELLDDKAYAAHVAICGFKPPGTTARAAPSPHHYKVDRSVLSCPDYNCLLEATSLVCPVGHGLCTACGGEAGDKLRCRCGFVTPFHVVGPCYVLEWAGSNWPKSKCSYSIWDRLQLRLRIRLIWLIWFG